MIHKFTIYRHTNRVNGKRYVGQTVTTMEFRWNKHVLDAMRQRGSPAFSAAIRKYGADAFSHEVLDVVRTQAGADIAETLWIKQSRSRVPHLRFNLLDRVIRVYRPRNPNLTPEAIERANEMRVAGASLREIATYIHVSTTTMCRVLAREKSARQPSLLFNLLSPRIHQAA